MGARTAATEPVRRIELAAVDAEWLIRGALAATSTDDVTPILTAILWEVTADRVTVTATDRYRVHQLHVRGNFADAAGGEFRMDRQQAKRLLRSFHTPRRVFRTQIVSLEWVDPVPRPQGFSGRIHRKYEGAVTFTILSDDGPEPDSISHTGSQIVGNFPPVGRLFPTEASLRTADERMTEFGINTSLFRDLKWIQRDPTAPLRFLMPTLDSNARQQPILVVNQEGTARALLQPNLLLREQVDYGTAPDEAAR